MLTIDTQNNRIAISDEARTLTNVAASQLSFWKFTFDVAVNAYVTDLNEQLFLKVVNYFKKHSFTYKLSKDAEKYSKEIEVINLNFENTKQLAANYKSGIFDITQFEDFKKFINENVKRTLKIHQLKAAFHLYLINNGANFSVPGSGKTTVVLSVYEKLRQEGKVNALFVVGPPSSFGPWKNEFLETLGRTPKTVTLAGGNKNSRKKTYYDIASNKKELYLTSFHTLLSDQKDVTHFLKQKHVSALFVVDEAHYMKQIKGNWARAILQQSEKAAFRCVLTGTPMPKSYTDIYNLFDFLWPRQNPISSQAKTLIKQFEKEEDDDAAKNILEDTIGPLFYRVRKADLNLKRQNFLIPTSIKMGKHEKLIYDAIYNKIKYYSKAEDFKNAEFIGKLAKGRMMRLRQAVSYPKLLNSAIENYSENLIGDLQNIKTVVRQYDSLEVPGKIKYLIKLVKELQKRKLKVVIWTNFIGTIKLIEKHIKESGFNCKKIYGETPVDNDMLTEVETREKIRDEFVDPKSGLDILIANPAACAESISLHKTCHNAVYYDLSYNCAQYLQSLDRIHRVGGSENTEANYHFLQYQNSIDLDIKENLDKKTKKMFSVIEQDYAIYSMEEPDGDAEAYARIFLKKK